MKNKIKKLFNELNKEKNKYFKNFLIFSCIAFTMSLGGITGFAINGLIGSTFGIALGYVSGKLAIFS